MKVEFKKSFEKDLRKITDVNILAKIKIIIEQIEMAVSLREVTNIKKLEAEGNYFPIKVSDYRIGIRLVQDTVIFVRVLPRKDMYRYFP